MSLEATDQAGETHLAAQRQQQHKMTSTTYKSREYTEKPAPPESDIESALEAHEMGSTEDGTEGAEHHARENSKAADAERPPLTRVVTAQDWSGPDDPENPLNWSLLKKACHFWPVAFLGFAVTAASSIITPANRDLQIYFGVSRTVAILPLTLYVIGLGLGPTIAAPVSEMYGRSIVYKITLPVCILFLVGSGLSKSFASLCVTRILAGIAGGPVLAVGAGTNADTFLPKDRAFSSSLFIMMPFLGPGLGPIIGGFAAQYRGWQWTIWCMIIILGVAYLTCLPMHETYKKTILQKRAKKLGLKPPPGPNVFSIGYLKTLLMMTIGRPVTMIFTESIVFLFGVYNSFAFAILFSFFAAFPYTFTTVYNFNTWQNGLVFGSVGVGVIAGVAVSITCDRLIYLKKHKVAAAQGRPMLPPEERLYPGMIGAFALPIGLFWFAWTARSDVHWIVPILSGIPFALGNMALFLSSVLYLMDVYGPMNGASAMAANGLMRYTTGAVFPLFAVQMYERLGIDWATSLLGFICVAMLPIPFVFYKYGPQIRKRSRYNTA
ncbi:putative transporter mfs2 [Cercospora beticola]|uniref:Putative transporter mfs2 n=1 Tax=Cercospora beticola TaxID=122368 RepID=A0A2G5HAS1_CERBT|nr:putative transporter mfs2 [Cercospora beticola]PIA89644.1 putative transporter mfs2 [Cercospora beticola]WPB03613.1 hypothetical protein RHO25_008253 [Cercospora beticola]CAK1357644.1 unnamed protein product [Cercospora beticola]